VFVGIAINLVSNYLKTPLDQRLSRYSERWKQWAEERRLKNADEIGLNLDHQSILSLTLQKETRAWLQVMTFCIIAIALRVQMPAQPFSSIPDIISFIVQTIMILASLLSLNRAFRLGALIRQIDAIQRDIIAEEETEPDLAETSKKP